MGRAIVNRSEDDGRGLVNKGSSRGIVNKDYNNGIFVDSEYANFSLRGHKYHARKRAEAEAQAKAQDLEKTKAELEKTKADINDLKNNAEKIAQQIVQNTPAPAPTTSYKIPLIIGGVLVLGVATFFIIKKLRS